MIKVKVQYPWGKRFLKYDTWVYKIGYIDKGEVVSSKEINSLTAHTQKEYNDMVELFKKRREDALNRTDYNTNYFEYTDIFGTRIFEYISGFLAEKP